MATAAIWAYLVVAHGAAGAVLFAYLTARAKAPPLMKLLGVYITGTCAYCAVLWGGSLAGAWEVVPETGRPALFLCLTSLVVLGILAFGRPR